MDTLFLQKPSVVARFEPEEFGFAFEDSRREAFLVHSTLQRFGMPVSVSRVSDAIGIDFT
jgi:hypothetical protein